MTISLQNLRSITPGVTPASLAPGQLCFNLADDVMFVGDGSSYKTSFDGTQQSAPAGAGWFSMPLKQSNLGQYFIINPQSFGDNPVDGDTLTYSASLGKAVWLPTADVSSIYTTTNSLVASSPGTSTNEKISNALSVTPIEGDAVIVSGVPGDQYQGYYLFLSGSWTYAAGYAGPTAVQVPFANSGTGLLATNVQGALSELSSTKLQKPSNAPDTGDVLVWGGGAPLWQTPSVVYPTAAQVSWDNTGTELPYTNVQDALSFAVITSEQALQEADSAQADATAAQVTANIALTAADDAETNAANALAIANTALPKAGGTMTGDIVFSNGQPVDAGIY